MIAGRRVIVVVPAFDEERLVGGVVRTIPDFVDRVVVVDDGSADRTAGEARASGDPRVEVVRHPYRRGVGAAIATGYRAAIDEPVADGHATDAIAVMAGDGQMDPDDLRRVVLPIVRGEADYVKGDRFGDDSTRSAMGLPRWIGGHVFSGLTALAIGQRVRDSQCGYTAIARCAVRAIDLESLWPSFGYPNDLLGILAAEGRRIVEVPVRAVYGTERSKLRLRHLPPIFFLVARAAVRRRASSGGGTLRHPNVDSPCARASTYHPEGDRCAPPDPRPAPLEVSER
jgi:glycosyltransferase involved in cell wall biosynthesis